MFGQPVYPRLSARNIGREAIVFISAPPRLDVTSWSAFWTDDLFLNRDGFFDCYSQLLTMIALARDFEPHPVTRFYDELAQVAKASRWVMALTLAGCTEGLAKLLRPKLSVKELEDEAQWSKDADSLAEKIEKLEAVNALKKRAIEAVRQTKGASTAGTLKAIQKSGAITPDQFAAWSDLRHKVAHGNLIFPYSNEEQDKKLMHLVDIVRASTQELLKRA
jgi:hypothetical protein